MDQVDIDNLTLVASDERENTKNGSTVGSGKAGGSYCYDPGVLLQGALDCFFFPFIPMIVIIY